MKLIQRAADSRTPEQRQWENKLLFNGVLIGLLLMNSYYALFGYASQTVRVIGSGFPLFLLIISYTVSKSQKKGKK